MCSDHSAGSVVTLDVLSNGFDESFVLPDLNPMAGPPCNVVSWRYNCSMTPL